MGDEDWIELKFRLADGTDIGPSKYSQLMTVASLKEKIIAQWPKDKENAPKLINEVKLINGGKILENNTTLSEARSLLPIGELPGIVTTMHVVLRPPFFEKKKEKLQNDPPMKSHCVCCIL
ncbi:Ubiquitin-like domain superfamily [Arabidopsis suecica]|uniref:Membrane-anchored ubiquitin-fold protein n=1 Tax=Arabidopsis suecica TaxID=45249 RepID=A0A8T2BSU0_ARASU|nr:Ubiquitin-like domain superfamily [Arabidopsis suecica]